MLVLFLYLTLVHTTIALTANPLLMYELCTHAPVTTVNKTSITGNINPMSVQYKHNDNKINKNTPNTFFKILLKF